MFKTLFVLLLVVLGGCSATSLRCGVDGDSSFVELANLPQDLSTTVRYYKDLCGFAYQAEPEGVIRLIDQTKE